MNVQVVRPAALSTALTPRLPCFASKRRLSAMAWHRIAAKATKNEESWEIEAPTPTSLGSSIPPRPVTVESAKELLEELLDAAKFGKRGELWFLGQVFLILLLVFPPSGIRQIVDVFGGCCLLGGLTLISLGGLNLGESLSPLPQPRDTNHVLVTDGVYQLVRHPMYGGILICGIGLSLFTGDEARLALTALLFLVLDQKANVEEEYLEEKYPVDYKGYKKSGVKKLIPYIY